MKRRASIPAVVAIGGFDPSCGAGVVADARSIEAMGALPLAVVTAITVQSGSGVRSSSAVSPAQVLAQLEELLRSLPVAIVKIGQIPTASVAVALARRLERAGLPVVLDPVMTASGGGALATGGAIAAISRSLVPLASLLTVNLPEAAQLTGRSVSSFSAMRRAAEELASLGAGAVLVKGGHLRGNPVDLLHIAGREHRFAGRRLAGSMHGTGCALAAAAAARMALGDDVEAAVGAARNHVRQLLRDAIKTGRTRIRSPGAY